MKKYLNVKNFIIVILVIIALLEFFNPKGFMPNRTVFETRIDTVPYPIHDTIPLEVEVEVEVPVLVEKEVPYAVHDTVTVKIDTNSIVQNYLNSKNVFTNTYKFTNNQGSITITDTISKNKIIGRKYTTKITPIVDTLRLPAIFKREIYAGIDGRFDKPNLVQLLGLGIMLKTKENTIYKIDLGLQNQVIDGVNGKFVPYIGGGVYWKVPTKN